MRGRRWILAEIFTLLLVAGAAGYVLLTPRVVSYSPPQGSAPVSGSSPVQVTFSRPVRETNASQYLVLSPATTGVYQVIGRTLIFTPSIPWGQDVQVSVTVLPGIRSTLGLPLRQGTSFQFSTSHPWLLYLLDTGERSNLYRIDPAGLDVQPVLEPSEDVLDYWVDAQGALWYSIRTGTGSLMLSRDPHGGSARQLLACKEGLCTQPRVSPDGKWLIYHLQASIGTPALWKVALLQGMPTGTPSRLAEPDHLTRDPAFSSKNRLVYYDETASTFCFTDLADPTQVCLENGTGEPGSWSPDGSVYTAPDIRYSSGGYLTPEYSSQLLNYDPWSGTISELTRDVRMEDIQPVYSPDGRQIVFARRFLNPQNWTPGRQIWLMNSDGTNVRPLTQSAVDNHLGFAWSPDGRQLAYLQFNTASLTGQRQLWLMDVQSGEKHPLLMEAYHLQWLP